MKKTVGLLMLCLLLFVGCAGKTAIPFAEGEMYAVAYLGYQDKEALTWYIEQYGLDADLPTYHISDGDYYLVVPRYADTSLALSRIDTETSECLFIYETANCTPFVVQCNVSDILPDAMIVLKHEAESARFTPEISLKDGTLTVGDKGRNITKE